MTISGAFVKKICSSTGVLCVCTGSFWVHQMCTTSHVRGRLIAHI